MEEFRSCKSSQNTCCCLSHRFHICWLGRSRMQAQSHRFTRQLKYVSSKILKLNCKRLQRQRSEDKRFLLRSAQNLIPVLSNTASALQRAEIWRKTRPNIWELASRPRWGAQMWFTVYCTVYWGESFVYQTATVWGCSCDGGGRCRRPRCWEKVTGRLQAG